MAAALKTTTRAVIFDLDGTLLDTEDLYLTAAREICSRYGAVYSLELKRSLMGGDAWTNAQIVATTLGLPIAAADYLTERNRLLSELWPEAKPMPGACDLMDALRARAIPIAIATSGHTHLTQLKLQPHAFLAATPVVLCGDDARLTRGKPAPDIFLLAARALGVPPEACAVVEDSGNGVRAALAAGMHTVALIDPRWGLCEADFDGAAHCICSLAELTLDMLGIDASDGA